jgi:hypothetical protein
LKVENNKEENVEVNKKAEAGKGGGVTRNCKTGRYTAARM